MKGHRKLAASSSFLLVAFAAVVLLLPAAAQAKKTHHHRWTVTYESISPDCFVKPGVTVNGQSPGPTIDAEQGDTVVVDVTNDLFTDGLAIHWHGIHQIGTPWSDGTGGVTQCPILPGESFRYKFVVNKYGTFMYHAHYGMLRSAGLYGLIRVAPPAASAMPVPFKYDYDESIILSDWWHQSPNDQATGLSSIPFGWVGEPQSLLINGRAFNCPVTAPGTECNATAAGPTCPAPYVISVVPGKTYRLRIASVTSLSSLSFQIEGHNMTVVAADGNYVKPFVTSNLFIYSGETYSVIVTADQDPTRNYWASATVVARKPATPAAVALFSYRPNNDPLRLPPTPLPAGRAWNDTAIRDAQGLAIRAHPAGYNPCPPPSAGRRIVLLNTQNRIDGHLRWAINNVSFEFPKTPYLVALKEHIRHVFDEMPPPDNYGGYGSYDIGAPPANPNATYGNSIYKLEFGSTVDVVLQNANTLTPNNSEAHPWHLHGHDFWVVGYGSGEFDPARDPAGFNLEDPIQKNTVAVQPYSWTAIRFVADNPGVWAFHCHIESHFFLGMLVVFEEGVERVKKLPDEVLGCGKTKDLIG